MLFTALSDRQQGCDSFDGQMCFLYLFAALTAAGIDPKQGGSQQ